MRELKTATNNVERKVLVKRINRKKQRKSCVVIDDLPTIDFRGLDNLIATARSNKDVYKRQGHARSGPDACGRAGPED